MGLIFLSAMATSIAIMCGDKGLGPEVALGTSLATLTISTTLVGIATVAVGRLLAVAAGKPCLCVCVCVTGCVGV